MGRQWERQLVVTCEAANQPVIGRICNQWWVADSCNQFKWCHLFSNLRAGVTIDSILHAPFIHSFQSFIIHDGGDDGGGDGGDGDDDGDDDAIITIIKFHNFDQISQLWQNFTMLTKFHNFHQISQMLKMTPRVTWVRGCYQNDQIFFGDDDCDDGGDGGDDDDDDDDDGDDGNWKSFIFYWKFLANKNLWKHQFNGLSIESLNRWQILKIFLNSKINPLIPLENWLKLKIKSQDDDQHVRHEPDWNDWHEWVWEALCLHPAVEGHVWELWQGQVKILMNISIDADMLVPKASALL